jgi:hypothetical protein
VAPRRIVAMRLAAALSLVGALLSVPAAADERDLTDDFWERSGMHAEASLGGVLRLDLDLDGDGQVDLLLANGQSLGNSSFADWHIYRALDGRRFQYLGTVSFAPALFRLLADPPRIEALTITRSDAEAEEPTTILSTYGIDATSIALLSSRTLSPTEAEASRKSIDDWRTSVHLRVLAADLDPDGLLEDPTWTELKEDTAAEGVRSLEGLVVVQ